MTDASKKTLPVMNRQEVMAEFKNRIAKLEIERDKKPSLIEGLSLLAANYSAVISENEARKSPEQKALEAKQSQLRLEESQLQNSKQEKIKCEELLIKWIKHDTWLIHDEALNLAKGKKPESETIFDTKDSNLWELVQSCAGFSLKVINPQAKPKQWLVKPFEWVRWLKEKEQYVHPQLEDLLIPKTLISPTLKTSHAINSREKTKRDRINAIKNFEQQTQELARKSNFAWDREAIPVTKQEFLKVFAIRNPAFKRIKPDTFDRDIADIGLKFKRGTKSNKNNILNQLFSAK